jgi:hypothetical protein
LKKYRIKQTNKSEIKEWCKENLGTENVRWWVHEDIMGLSSYFNTDVTLCLDVTEEEESQLMYFILKYGE